MTLPRSAPKAPYASISLEAAIKARTPYLLI